MQLERIDEPASAKPVPPTPIKYQPAADLFGEFAAGDKCKFCEDGELLEAGGKLLCGFCFKLPVSRIVHEYKPEPEELADEEFFTLEQFPDYVFDSETYEPTRVTRRSTGPVPHFGPIKPSRITSGSRYYSLVKADGKRLTISTSKLRDLRTGKCRELKNTFEIPEFPRTYFHADGRAYRKRDNKEHKYEHAQTIHGFPIRRYRLWHSSGRCQYFTDEGARRYNAGKCEIRSAYIPEGCVKMGCEFPDFCVDPVSGQPYRISSFRFNIYAPMPLSLRREGRYYIRDFRNKRHMFTPKKLLEYVGIESPDSSNLTARRE